MTAYVQSIPVLEGKEAGDGRIKILRGIDTDDAVFPEYEIRLVRDAVSKIEASGVLKRRADIPSARLFVFLASCLSLPSEPVPDRHWNQCSGILRMEHGKARHSTLVRWFNPVQILLLIRNTAPCSILKPKKRLCLFPCLGSRQRGILFPEIFCGSNQAVLLDFLRYDRSCFFPGLLDCPANSIFLVFFHYGTHYGTLSPVSCLLTPPVPASRHRQGAFSYSTRPGRDPERLSIAGRVPGIAPPSSTG